MTDLALFDTTGAPTTAPRAALAERDYADALTRDAFAGWAEALRGYSAADRDAAIAAVTPPGATLADAERIITEAVEHNHQGAAPEPADERLATPDPDQFTGTLF